MGFIPGFNCARAGRCEIAVVLAAAPVTTTPRMKSRRSSPWIISPLLCRVGSTQGATEGNGLRNPLLLSRKRPGSARRVPGGETAAEVLGVEAALTELRGNSAPHVKAISAIDEYGFVRRELLRPFVDLRRITPGRAFHHVVVAR